MHFADCGAGEGQEPLKRSNEQETEQGTAGRGAAPAAISRHKSHELGNNKSIIPVLGKNNRRQHRYLDAWSDA